MEAGTILADFYISKFRLSRVVQALLFVFESVHNKLHGGMDVNVRSNRKITHFITSPTLSTLSVMFPFPLLARLVRLINKMVKIFLLIDLGIQHQGCGQAYALQQLFPRGYPIQGF